MPKLIILAAFIFFTGNISAQQSNDRKRTFDIKWFKENREDGEYRFKLNDTTDIE